MKRQSFLGLLSIILVAGTAANVYFLQDAYFTYRSVVRQNAVELKTSADIQNAKEQAVTSNQQGEIFAAGKYAYEVRDTSKIDPKQLSGKLLVASNAGQSVNYLLATGPSTNIKPSILTAGWKIQTLSDDPMWAPGACSSKPTYFIQSKYVFIDDGKTTPADRYNSYVVFNLLTQKYLYFGGDNFTDEQATHERIMSVVDQNDQMVFYIDHSDTSGPLANSTSFKHARGYAPGYIIRRVLDLSTLHYTDYKLAYTVPSDGDFDFYYVDNGTDGALISLTSDNTDTYYSGVVKNNKITLATQSLTVQPLNNNAPTPAEVLASALAPSLKNILPAFVPDVNSSPKDSNLGFSLSILGSHDDTQYLIVNNSQSGYTTPLIYNKANRALLPMTTQPVLGWGDYVPLGVF